MGAAERRNEIIKILCRRRHETIGNLAFEFGVSERTIRRDIETLSLTEPIYTQTGRYSGGVYILDNYFMNKRYMSDSELKVLNKLYVFSKDRKKCVLTHDELSILKSIVLNYTKPLNEKGRKHEK